MLLHKAPKKIERDRNKNTNRRRRAPLAAWNGFVEVDIEFLDILKFACADMAGKGRGR